MFTGEFKYSIDSKGRVVFPPRFREELGTTFMPQKEWKIPFLYIQIMSGKF